MIKIMTAEFHLAVSLSVFLHLCHWGNTWRTKILTFITPVLKKNYNKSNCLLWKWFAIFSLELRVYVFASDDHCRICKHFVFTVIVHRKKSDKLTYKSRQSKTSWPPDIVTRHIVPDVVMRYFQISFISRFSSFSLVFRALNETATRKRLKNN